MRKILFRGTFYNRKEFSRDSVGLRPFSIPSAISEKGLERLLDNACVETIEGSNSIDQFELVVDVLAAQGKLESPLYKKTVQLLLSASTPAAQLSLRVIDHKIDELIDPLKKTS